MADENGDVKGAKLEDSNLANYGSKEHKDLRKAYVFFNYLSIFGFIFISFSPNKKSARDDIITARARYVLI